MSLQNKRTTVYLDPDLHKALRLKPATISRSVSDLVNDAVREALADDAEDIAAFDDPPQTKHGPFLASRERGSSGDRLPHTGRIQGNGLRAARV